MTSGRAGGRPGRAGKLEWAAIFLLPAGSIVFPILGWIAGVVLLWASRVWSTREKVIGTLVIPGGLSTVLIAVLIAGSGSCSRNGGSGHVAVRHCAAQPVSTAILLPVLVVSLLGGIGTPIFLARRATARRILR